MTSLLDNLKAPHGKEASSLKLLTLSTRHFLNSRYQLLLIPVTIYRGYAQAFIVSDFTAVRSNDINYTHIYISNGYIVPMEFRVHLFPRISSFSRRTKMHLNGMLLIGGEFFKIIIRL